LLAERTLFTLEFEPQLFLFLAEIIPFLSGYVPTEPTDKEDFFAAIRILFAIVAKTRLVPEQGKAMIVRQVKSLNVKPAACVGTQTVAASENRFNGRQRHCFSAK